MKYIEKLITDKAGHENLVWVATDLNIQLYRSQQNPDDYGQTAQIIMKGFGNKNAILDGKKPSDTKIIEINKVSELSCYSDVVTEAVKLILDNNNFVDATLKDTNQ